MKTTKHKKDFLSILRSLDAEELGNECKRLEEDVYELRFKVRVGQLTDHASYGRARRRLAMAKTIQAQRFGQNS